MDSLLVKEQDDTKEEGIIKMENKNGIWLPDGCEKSDNESEVNSKKDKKDKINWTVVGIIITILLAEVGWHRDERDRLNSLKGVPTQIEKLDQKIDKLDDKVDELDDRVKYLEIKAMFANEKSSEETSASVKDNGVYKTGASAFEETDVIGTDIDGIECIAGDYVNKPILLTYNEDGREVFFLGQYNEKYQWDGYCVTNAYNADGTLFGICESNFSDGKRLDYKSFVYDENSEWIYSKRICNEGYNSGENKVFEYTCSDIKNFTNTNVRVTDIISVDDYLDKHKMILLSEYQGNTADGKYNDTTGESYYIGYYEDGTVKMVYQGNIVDGKLNDNTGKAWQIACDRDNQALYQYYSGKFQNDEKVDKNNTDKNIVGLTQEDIEKILKEKGCKLNLKWDEQSLSKE